jgi:hypothetical protein
VRGLRSPTTLRLHEACRTIVLRLPAPLGSIHMLPAHVIDLVRTHLICKVVRLTFGSFLRSCMTCVTFGLSTNREGESPPHIALMANKLDLAHLRAVKIEQHTTFAKDQNMSSHFVCAKNGDQISLAFRRIVGVITGIEMTKVRCDYASSSPNPVPLPSCACSL